MTSQSTLKSIFWSKVRFNDPLYLLVLKFYTIINLNVIIQKLNPIIRLQSVDSLNGGLMTNLFRPVGRSGIQKKKKKVQS